MPLVKDGCALMILEAPFYGNRKPPWQKGSKLRCVSDLLSLGNATIEEGLGLLAYIREAGFGPAGVCGFSMGGVHAMMIASVAENPIALVSLLAPRCASQVFTDGALSHSVDWGALAAAQYRDLDREDVDVGETVEQRMAEAYSQYAEHSVGGWTEVPGWGVTPAGRESPTPLPAGRLAR